MKKICIALVSALAFGVVNAEETDLVVVGSGGAGLSAAIMAAQQGKKVNRSRENADYRRKHTPQRRRYECRPHDPAAGTRHHE